MIIVGMKFIINSNSGIFTNNGTYNVKVAKKRKTAIAALASLVLSTNIDISMPPPININPTNPVKINIGIKCNIGTFNNVSRISKLCFVIMKIVK